ncbi:TonB-dependent receptor [Pedobacter sp. PWIIR3]
MKRKLTSCVLVLLSAVALLAYRSDDDPFDALLKKMSQYNEDYPQEKVHLHLDKPYYAVGDDIWFKAYVINTQTSKLSAISGALYVELIDEKDSLKQQIKLPLISGITAGDFKLPDAYDEGNYRIRAYTQLMKNSGTDFFFDKTIKIGNSWSNRVFTTASYSYNKTNTADEINAQIKFTDKDGKPYPEQDVSYEVLLRSRNVLRGKGITDAQGDIKFKFNNPDPSFYKSGKILATLTLPDKKKVAKEILIKATSNAVDVQLFPEGGNLVENIPSRVGIKIVNANGLGEDADGILLDDGGQEVNKFSTAKYGMGSFIVNPQTDKNYTVKVKFKDGSEKTYPLPKALSAGCVISAKNNAEDIQIRIMLSEQLLNKGEIKLVAQHNGNVYSITKATSAKQVVAATFKKKDLPSGIMQFTVFSADNTPLAERLVFVRNQADEISAAVSTDKQEYRTKEKVNVSLHAIVDEKPIVGSFSVAVTNASAVIPDELNESNILTSLLLTSDISGYVENPNYYFIKNDETTREHLDNLMLTQGWRRFLWKNVIAGVKPKTVFEPEKTLRISGLITNFDGKPLPAAKVSLYSTSGGFFFLDTLSDANGRFSFDQLSFPDSTKFIVQARNAKGKKNTEIKVDVVSGQAVSKNKNTGDIIVNVNQQLASYLKQSENYFNDLTKSGRLEKSIVLKEVKIEQKKNKAPNSSNMNGPGQADDIITADKLQNCPTLSQCLQGRVAGLMVTNGVATLLRNQGAPMQIVIDGMYVEPDFLDAINPMDVETIEVLKSIGYTSIYGSRGGSGLLVITTKRGGNGASTFTKFVPGIITFSPKGYTKGREFYSPKYDVPESAPASDLRSTIYWNPLVATKEDGKTEFSFYNSAEPGTYRVVIEGINISGNLAHTVYTYTVK